MNDDILKVIIKNAVKDALNENDKSKILSLKSRINSTIITLESLVKDAKIDYEKTKNMTNYELQRYTPKLAQFKVDLLKRGIRNFLQDLVNDKFISRAAGNRILASYNSSGVSALAGSDDLILLQNMISALKETDVLLDKKLR